MQFHPLPLRILTDAETLAMADPEKAGICWRGAYVLHNGEIAEP